MPTRRHVITIATAATLGISSARAETRVRRIGWLTAQSPPSLAPYLAAFRQGLVEQQLIEGQNLEILARFGFDDPTRVPALAQELVDAKVELIIVQGAAVATLPRLNLPVPVVFVTSSDPIVAGLAKSLAEPIGNRTGLTFMAFELLGKRLELLRSMLPDLSRVVLLGNPLHAGANLEHDHSVAAGKVLGLEVSFERTANGTELEGALATIVRSRPGAISLLPDGFAIAHRARIMEVATAERIPVISGWPVFAQAGAVCTYGPRLQLVYRRVAAFVARILAGARPADLPIERPTHFELVLNKAAAQNLGIVFPRNVLARADEVIG